MATHTSEAEIRALVEKGMKFPEIAQQLGVRVGPLRQACSLLGIKSPHRVPRGAAAFYEDLAAGLSLREVGAKHGVSHAYVHASLRRAGLPSSHKAILLAQAG